MGFSADREVPLNAEKVQSVPLQHEDSRLDEEIEYALLHPGPVVSEKNVWAFWDTGFSTMRPWAQRNVIGWVRLLGPEWTVRVLDRVEGSAANIFNFLDPSSLPACLGKGTMSGRFSGQHASDMVRLPCIYEHGGVWMDVGIMLFMHLDQVCWAALENPAVKFEVALASADPSLMSGLAENFFIAARKGNGFIRRWMIIFFEVWKGRSGCQGIHSHPLFQHLVAEGNVARFLQSASEDKLDYFAAYLAYERLRLLEDPNDGFSGPNFCKNRILLIEYREFASAAMLTHNDGPQQFKFLATEYDEEPTTKDTEDAQGFCNYMLSQTAMMKLYHWKEEKLPTLADLWDMPENADSDHRDGTFAEYMRYVSTHYTQTRNIAPVKFPPIKETILVAGVVESPDD